jgi:hypothetical protein
MRRFAYSGNGDLDLNSGLERDGGDLLDDIGGRGQVDQSLVDPHLVSVPSLGTLTTRAGTLVFVHDSAYCDRLTSFGWCA